MNHLPLEQSKILTEKLKSVGIEVKTEYRYISSSIPKYTLSELLELLPDNVKGRKPMATYWLEMFKIGRLWTVGYFLEDELMSNSLKEFESTSPLLATYKALLWAIDEGYVEGKK